MAKKADDAGLAEIVAEVFARLKATEDPARRTDIFREALRSGAGPLRLGGDAAAFAHLAGIEMPGARLRRADLSFADLSGARLSRSVLSQANLSSAKLDGCDLKAADLSHADCRGAHMDEADLHDALLEEIRLDGASLRFADLRGVALEAGSLIGADLWGARLSGADLAGADLTNAAMGEAAADGCDFSGAVLRGANLAKTDLAKVSFVDADLQGAQLRGANLSEAVLSGARLQGVDLTNCDLSRTYWRHAQLDRTPMSREQLGGRVGEECDGDYDGAAQSYVVLERNFRELGDNDAASWAYRRRRRMEKALNRERTVTALKAKRWGQALKNGLKFASDELVEWVCDYGESLGRVFGALFAVYLIFFFLYEVTGGVSKIVAERAVVTHDIGDVALFALIAMTASGVPSITLVPSYEAVSILLSIQAFVGIFLAGLLGFVAGITIRRQ